MISLFRAFALVFPAQPAVRVVFAALMLAFPVLQPATVLAQTESASAPAEAAIAEEIDPFREEILTIIAQRTGGGGQDRHLSTIADYYSDPANPALWVGNGAANTKARTLVDILKTAYLDVLDPDDYNADTLAGLLDATLVPDLARLEVGLSLSLLDYTRHLAAGRVEPSKINSELAIFPTTLTLCRCSSVFRAPATWLPTQRSVSSRRHLSTRGFAVRLRFSGSLRRSAVGRPCLAEQR